MIDTDKYEGHTPAPWYERKHYDTEAPSVAAGEHDILLAICGKGLKHHSSPQYAITRPVEEQEANAKLIADAPLLLEEVKRLRKEVKMLWQYVDTEQMYNDGLLTVEGEMIE